MLSGKGWKNTDMWHESSWLYPVIYTHVGAPKDVSRNEAIIPSKRWEAWREGIEDYTYLFMLRDLIKRSEPSPQTIQARKTLASAVQQVLSEPEDLTRAEEQRRKILKTMMALKGQGKLP